MTTNEQVIASVLGLLSVGGVASCNKPEQQATEVPSAEADAEKQCLHSDGCCGGHTAGDDACGAARAIGEAPTADAVAQTFAWTLEPGKFAEINLELRDGAKSSASFESDAPLAWNVHSHPSDTPVIHAEGSAAKADLAFAADKGGAYSYLWVNNSKQAVKLEVDLRIEGGGRVHSTLPE